MYFEIRKPIGKSAKLNELEYYLEQNKGKSGIVYCATRKAVDAVTEHLISIGFKASSYHAGMNQAERNTAQQDFIHDNIEIMVATNAFGMGIDKSNVSFVLHYNMPKNMESYYQEAGRAGRDGSPAECILLFNAQDIVINKFLIENGESDHKDRDYQRLREMESYCLTTKCLRQYILDYFEDNEQCQCDNCSNCRTEYEKRDITTEAQKILSCIYRMQGRFGLVMVIEVLRGSQNQKVLNAKLDKLKTYGIMSENHPNEIRQIAQYLIQQGYIEVIGNQYPVLKAGEKALDTLKNNEAIEMPIQEVIERTSIKRESKKASPKRQINNALFEQLKSLRLSLAQKESVPAFVVFSDATLNDMCVKLPVDDVGFLAVSGVGQVKLSKYGADFLKVIRGFQKNIDDTNDKS